MYTYMMPYDAGNPGAGLWKAQKGGGARPVNGIHTALDW